MHAPIQTSPSPFIPNTTIDTPVELCPRVQAVLDAPLPDVRNPILRHCERKVIAAEIRALFRELRLKGFKVSAPKYSMAQAVNVEVPRNHPEPTVADGPGYITYHPDYRTAMNAVLAKTEAILLAAFPDLGDRSDSNTDYYDYRLSVR